MSMISLIPEGGLCNRMRSIASVWQLAQLAGRPLNVNWMLTDDMNCSFQQLFDPADMGFKVTEINATGVNGKLLKLGQSVNETIAGLMGRSFLGPEASAKAANDIPSLMGWAKGPSPRIRTNTKMLDAPGMFDVFRPQRALQAIIDSYQDRLEGSVGVHIRRSDNVKSSQYSSLASFVSLMTAELDKDSSTHFFVATDSPETLVVLQKQFGPRVFEHTKSSLLRNDPSAICDALIDLYCLANCRKLIGSYWSSFSDTAWEIYNIDHHIVRDGLKAA